MKSVPWVPLSLAIALAGCAHSGPRFERAASLEAAALDPWEKTNRRLYSTNKAIDRAVLRPVVNAYRTTVPESGRRGIRGVYDNANEPLNFANAVLQGKFASALRAVDRFAINTVLGVGGLADHATGMDLPERPHDFGQTMAVYGVPSGPFLMMPFFGPSTLRDGIGFTVDFFADPFDFGVNPYLGFTERVAKFGFRIVDARAGVAEQAEQLLVGSADEYATVRSAWLQLRRQELWDGNPPPEPVDDEEILPYDTPADAQVPGAASAAAPLPSPLPALGSGTMPATPAATDPANPRPR